MIDLEFSFSGEIWLYSASKASWHFVTLPRPISDDIKAFTKHLAKGFRSVRVSAKIGESEWKTSIFPDSKSGCYFLPIKAAIRKAEGLGESDMVEVALRVGTE